MYDGGIIEQENYKTEMFTTTEITIGIENSKTAYNMDLTLYGYVLVPPINVQMLSESLRLFCAIFLLTPLFTQSFSGPCSESS